MVNRYERQMYFNEIGSAGQENLKNSRVVVLGVGALGSTIAEGLCRSGVGFIRVVDRDCVDYTNLHRQVLYTEEDASSERPKAFAAAEALKKINSQIIIEAMQCEISDDTIETMCADVDLILDGTDNMSARMALNKYALTANKPWIYGGAVMASGMTMNIIPHKTACLGCLIDSEDDKNQTLTCATAGVTGAITGVIGNIQVAEAIKILTQSPHVREPMLVVDLWNNYFEEIVFNKIPGCNYCGETPTIQGSQQTKRAEQFNGRDAVQVRLTEVGISKSNLERGFKNAGCVEYADRVPKVGVKESS